MNHDEKLHNTTGLPKCFSFFHCISILVSICSFLSSRNQFQVEKPSIHFNKSPFLFIKVFFFLPKLRKCYKCCNCYKTIKDNKYNNYNRNLKCSETSVRSVSNHQKKDRKQQKLLTICHINQSFQQLASAFDCHHVFRTWCSLRKQLQCLFQSHFFVSIMHALLSTAKNKRHSFAPLARFHKAIINVQ